MQLSLYLPQLTTSLHIKASSQLRIGLACLLSFSALINLLMLTGSVYMIHVYDRVLTSGSVPTLVGLFIIVVVLYAFLAFYDFLRSRCLSRLAAQFDRVTATKSFHRWLQSRFQQDAEVQSQPLRDLETIYSFISGPTIGALFDLLFMPLFLGVLFAVHPWLGWSTVAGACFVALIALLNRRVTTGPMKHSAQLDAEAREFAEASFRNAEALLAMGMVPAVTARWRRFHESALALSQKASDPSELLAAVSRSFRMLLQSAILTVGALLVLKHEISGGMIIASSVLSGRALAPVDQIIGQWRAIEKAREAHRRITSGREPSSDPPVLRLPDPTGRLEVSSLTRYVKGSMSAGSRRPILAEVSFALEPGDALGVLGSSASGKSTLARLLVGAWSPDAGDVRLDGATLNQWRTEDLSRHVGYLPQVIEMLPGSIRDNISRFDPNVTDEAIVEASRLVGIHEMILSLPEGYLSLIGASARHVHLSGGQMQRLALARAVCRMPKLVVLDEPNSNLDLSGEEALTGVIYSLREKGSVVVVMAHRPNAINAVNKLLVLEGGTAVAFGNKSEILPAKEGPTRRRFNDLTSQPPSMKSQASKLDATIT